MKQRYEKMSAVQRGSKKEAIEQMTNTAWICAYACLWNRYSFSEMEIERAKSLIRDYLMAAGANEKAFSIFCQRVVLAHQYVSAHPECQLPLPSRWLDRNNLNGFTGTKKWMEKLLLQRSALPTYRVEIRAYAESLLEMSIAPTASNFRYWKTYFSTYPALHNLFLTTIALHRYQTPGYEK